MDEPDTYEEAIRSRDRENWKNSMTHEINCLHKNETYKFYDLPKGKNSLVKKWVYKVKLNSKGDIEHYNARLIKGMHLLW